MRIPLILPDAPPPPRVPIFQRQVRTRQPNGVPNINWSNPITRGLIDALVLNGPPYIGAVTKQQWAHYLTGDAPVSAARGYGLTNKSVNTGLAIKAPWARNWYESGVSEFSVAHDVDPLYTGSWRTLWSLNADAYNTTAFAQIVNTANLQWYYKSSWFTSPSNDIIALGERTHVVYSCHRNSLRRWYIDGAFLMENTGALAQLGTTPYSPALFREGALGSTRGYHGYMSYWYVWGRPLSAGEALELRRNPWQIFQ